VSQKISRNGKSQQPPPVAPKKSLRIFWKDERIKINPEPKTNNLRFGGK
jgi:hypothetical protein